MEGRDIIPSLGDILDTASEKDGKLDELLQPYDHTCLFYIKTSLPNLRQVEGKRQNVKQNK